MNYINKWKKEAKDAYKLYKMLKQEGFIWERCEYVICNAYIDYLHLTKGPKIAENHWRYMHKGDRERRDEVNIVVREWQLS